MEMVKVLMLGPSGCGKSTLVNQYFEKEPEAELYERSYNPVLEDGLYKMICVDDEEVYIEIKGNSEYEVLRPMMIEAETFVIVVSDDELHSFIETRRQFNILLEVKENRTDIPIIFAINKVDRDDSKTQIEFWREKIQEIIQEFKLINVGIFETCVVKNMNVNELFEDSIKRHRYGTWKDVELLKQVISQDSLILRNKKKKCICM